MQLADQSLDNQQKRKAIAAQVSTRMQLSPGTCRPFMPTHAPLSTNYDVDAVWFVGNPGLGRHLAVLQGSYHEVLQLPNGCQPNIQQRLGR